MKDLKDIVITEIKQPVSVYTSREHYFEMKNRPSYGISFCNEGSICYYHNGKEYINDKNHAVILPQGQSYSLRGKEKGLFYLIDFKCENYSNNEFAVLPILSAQSLIIDAQKIQKLMLFDMNQLKVFGIFYNMLNTILQQPVGDMLILQPAVNYLEKNISDSNLSNFTLAAKAGISEVYFRKLFLKQYGISPKQYIIEKRITRAKQLLINSAYSVTAIASECGFSSVYLFCRTFKEKTGLTPTEYIKQNKIISI